MKKLFNKKIIVTMITVFLLAVITLPQAYGYFTNHCQGEGGRVLQLVNDTKVKEEKDELNKTKEENKELLDFMKDSLEEVSEVRLSSKLIDDPVCLTAGEGISFEMERVFNNMPDNPMPMKADRILEINPKHPIFERLKDLYTDDKDKVKEVAEVLYDQACLIEGFPIKDPIAYSRKICELLVK